MSEILIFDRYRPPIFPIQLLDKARTVIHVVPPTVELQEELQSRQTELHSLLDGGDEEQRTAMWDLAARLMSCNRNRRIFTADALSGKYGLDEFDLGIFYEKYTEFLDYRTYRPR